MITVADDEEEVVEIDPQVWKGQNTPLTMIGALVHANFEWDFRAVARVRRGRCQLGVGTDTLERKTFQLMGEGATWAEALKAASVPVGGSSEARRRHGVDRVESDGLMRVRVPPKSKSEGRAFQRALEAMPDKPEQWKVFRRPGQIRLKVGGVLFDLYERIIKEIGA